MQPTEETTRTLLVVDASFDLGNALADAALEHGWEPNVRVVVMVGDQPIPEAVKRAPFVVGAVRRPRHPSGAEALARAVFESPEIAHA